MSAQQFLDNAIGKVGEVLFGADYDIEIKKPGKPSSKPNPYSAKPNKGNFSGQSRNVFDTIKDKIKSMPGSQPAKPNPYAAKPTGQLTQKNAGSLLGLGNMTVGGAVTAPLVLGGSEDAGIKWRRLGYSSKAAYDTAVKNNASGGKTNNASDINKRLDQQKAERAAALARTKGGYDHSSGSYVGQDVAFVPDSVIDSSNSGRDDSRKIPGGGTQTGTNMSRSFNDLLATTNTSGYQPFSSNQLPTSAASPDAVISPKTQQILAGIQAGKQTDMSIDGYEGPAYTAIQPDSPQFAEAFGQDLADKYKSAADSKVTGYTKGGRLDQALSDTAGMQSYMSKFSSGDQERLANRAFLDTKGSMEGLRAKEAVNGVVYAQQQHYIAGSDPDGPAQKITRDQARDISNGDAKAQDFLSKKVDDLKKATPDTPAKEQDPLSAAGSAVKDGFAAGAKTDFGLNNNQGAPQTGVGPVVPTDQIPKDLSGDAGKKYLADLDAGRLFK